MWRFQWYGFDEELNLYRKFHGCTEQSLRSMPWAASRVTVWYTTDCDAVAPETIRPSREEVRAYKALAAAKRLLEELNAPARQP